MRRLGSSPLTRGKRAPAGRCSSCVGLIPAHAGKTVHPRESEPASAAHPRSRGENQPGDSSLPRQAGSSPLTRGKLKAIPAYATGGGLIPAHAGKTIHDSVPALAHGAHPRSRGENVRLGRLREGQRGSSPLTRGKRSKTREAGAACGLIPAHAGKTVILGPTSCNNGAHPRSRGENALARTWVASWGGSSPLTRGKQLTRRPGDSVRGLIPAHAGKTEAHQLQDISGRAHPRSRGENESMGS